jgi:hypothetical protein
MPQDLITMDEHTSVVFAHLWRLEASIQRLAIALEVRVVLDKLSRR